MKNYEARKTTYEVDGCQEPCYEVNRGTVLVRIAPFYYYSGKKTIIITEYEDGIFESQEVWDIEWDELNLQSAVSIARQYSAYL